VSANPEIVAIGHLIRERVIFPGHESDEVLGSPAAYSSVAVARLGGRVGLISRIGTDMPDHLLAPLRKAGVGCEGLHVVSGESTTATRLVYQPDGSKILEYAAKASPMTLEDIPESYRSAGLFNICTMDHDVELSEIAKIRALGRKMAVDLGGYGGAHVKPVRRPPGIPEELPALVGHFDLVKASDEDCRRLTGDPEADVGELGRRILAWGAEIFVATLGARGAVVLTRKDRCVIPPFQGNVIDPTGGGDVFFGGFLLIYLRTGDVQAAGRFAAATALCALEQSGGVRPERMPTWEQVTECMGRPTVNVELIYG
jgi:sugar/nucleoside kinase (ribokinase family)